MKRTTGNYERGMDKGNVLRAYIQDGYTDKEFKFVIARHTLAESERVIFYRFDIIKPVAKEMIEILQSGIKILEEKNKHGKT